MSKVSIILKKLMEKKEIRTAELARQAKLPQPTVHRIVTGVSPNPHASSLAPLADFFSVSIEQLRGLNPIPDFDDFTDITNNLAGWSNLPILSIEDCYYWLNNHPNKDKAVSGHLLCDTNTIHADGFCTYVPDLSMYPQFSKGTLLIVDPKLPPQDRHFVLAYLPTQEQVVFRQLLINSAKFYLKPKSPELIDFPLEEIQRENILGVVIESRTQLIE